MVTRRQMTDDERRDMESHTEFVRAFRQPKLRTTIQGVVLGAGFYGILAAGAVHLLLSRFLAMSTQLQAILVIAIAIAGAAFSGWQEYNRCVATDAAVANADKKLAKNIRTGEVAVFSSADTTSEFNRQENDEHPPLVVTLDTDTVTLQAMEQDMFEIYEPLFGECTIVAIPDGGPILSVTINGTTKRLSKQLAHDIT